MFGAHPSRNKPSALGRRRIDCGRRRRRCTAFQPFAVLLCGSIASTRSAEGRRQWISVTNLNSAELVYDVWSLLWKRWSVTKTPRRSEGCRHAQHEKLPPIISESGSRHARLRAVARALLHCTTQKSDRVKQPCALAHG